MFQVSKVAVSCYQIKLSVSRPPLRPFFRENRKRRVIAARRVRLSPIAGIFNRPRRQRRFSSYVAGEAGLLAAELSKRR